MSLIDYSICRKEKQDEILSPHRPVHSQRSTHSADRQREKT